MTRNHNNLAASHAKLPLRLRHRAAPFTAARKPNTSRHGDRITCWSRAWAPRIVLDGRCGGHAAISRPCMSCITAARPRQSVDAAWHVSWGHLGRRRIAVVFMRALTRYLPHQRGQECAQIHSRQRARTHGALQVSRRRHFCLFRSLFLSGGVTCALLICHRWYSSALLFLPQYTR